MYSCIWPLCNEWFTFSSSRKTWSLENSPLIPLWHHCLRVWLYPHNVTHLGDQFLYSVVIHKLQPTLLVYHSKKDGINYHRWTENPDRSPADVEEPQPPQKTETALALPLEGVSVPPPIQSVVSVDPQIFVVLKTSSIKFLSDILEAILISNFNYKNTFLISEGKSNCCSDCDDLSLFSDSL